MPRIVVILIAFNLLINTYGSTNTKVYLQGVLSALDKFVQYYYDNYHVMNLDGIFGLRILEGQVALLLETYAAGRIHHPNPTWLWPKLRYLHDVAHNISEASMTSLKKNDPQYYSQMQWLISRPMKFAKDYRRVDPTLRWHASVMKKDSKDVLQEAFSDRCMQELMGVASNRYTKCRMTAPCMEMMLQHGYEEYTVTHQLLYTLLAEQNQCTAELDKYLVLHGISKNVEEFRQQLCTNNLYEVQETVALVRGQIVPAYQDLFMEQMFVCPVLGFMDFLHSDFLKQILSWQFPSGCYGKMKFHNSHHRPAQQNNANAVVQQMGQNRLMMTSNQTWGFAPDVQDDNPTNMRRLLFEKTLNGGCLSHKTAVAIGAITQYLRYLVEPGSPQYQAYTSIDGTNYLMDREALVRRHAETRSVDVNGDEEQRPSDVGAAIHDQDLRRANEQLDPEEQARSKFDTQEEDMKHALPMDRGVKEVQGVGAGQEEEEEDEGYQEDEGEEEEEGDAGGDDDENNDYYDKEEDEQDQMGAGDLVHGRQRVLPAPHFNGAGNIHDEQLVNQRDEEYEQYIDEEEAERGKENENDADSPNKAGPVLAHNNFGRNEAVNEVNDDAYNYYDNILKEEPRMGRMEMERHKDLMDKLASENKILTTPKPLPPDPNSFTFGPFYIVLLVVMLILLVLMYRFIRKRRVLIRYRYR